MDHQTGEDRNSTSETNTKKGIGSRSDATTFERIEDKYLLSKESLNSFESLVSTHLDSGFPSLTTRFTDIESLYFDSGSLQFFSDHFRKGLDTRYKIRIRKYAPNGQWSATAPSFLELKMKTNGVSKKRRFWITHENRNQLILGKCLTFSDELQDLNEGLGKKKLNKRIREINWLVINYELVPQVRITYRRHAYERDGLRVTIDQNLKCDALSFVYPPVTKRLRKEEFWPRAFKMKDKFSNSTSVVVEIKHQRNIPAWFSHFMNENQVTQTSFSKYCWSMMHQIGYSLNKKYTVKVS